MSQLSIGRPRPGQCRLAKSSAVPSPYSNTRTNSVTYRLGLTSTPHTASALAWEWVAPSRKRVVNKGRAIRQSVSSRGVRPAAAVGAPGGPHIILSRVNIGPIALENPIEDHLRILDAARFSAAIDRVDAPAVPQGLARRHRDAGDCARRLEIDPHHNPTQGDDRLPEAGRPSHDSRAHQGQGTTTAA